MKKIPSKRNPQVEIAPGTLPLDAGLFRPGDRICMAVSGGADSIALLRALLAQRGELGIVLSVLHVEHGLRGPSAARDAAFVTALAEEFSVPCEVIAVDTPKHAAEHKESIEEAARNLRYGAFRQVLACGKVDKIATAHTLDDQAETVLMKLLRGAWTEGLSGIHPVLPLNGGLCIRPLLSATRAEIEAYLKGLGQPWCEDETNRSPDFTRNRVRHDLLPRLRQYNPRIAQALAHVAGNARAEERHWQAELARVLPQLLLPGKPVRGGGRSVATAPGSMAMALDVSRLQVLDAGLRRRVVRATAERCGTTLDFEATERLLEMIESSPGARSAKRLELPGGVRVERSARELQFERVETGKSLAAVNPENPVYALPVPGTIEALAFHARYTATVRDKGPLPDACVRAWLPGDRVELAHSSGPKKVKEVLERMGVRGEERVLWPVIVWEGKIVWMRGVEIAAGSDIGQPDRKGESACGVPSVVRGSKIGNIKVEEVRD